MKSKMMLRTKLKQLRIMTRKSKRKMLPRRLLLRRMTMPNKTSTMKIKPI